MLPENKWTSQEKWVWEQLKAGEPADFNKGDKYGGKLDPKEPEGWEGKGRDLRPRFLKTILLDEERRKTLAHKKVAILGARFAEPLDLSDAKLANLLGLAFCRFEKDVNFARLQTPNLISFAGSTFTGTLNMNGLRVEGSLLMSGKATFNEVDLVSARIGDQLNMEGSTFNKTLNMNSLQVEGSLLMREKATFNEVDLRGARIGGQLNMDGSTFAAKLNMDKLQVDSSLFMSDEAKFKEVVLVSANIGGQLSMTGSTFTGKLDMDSLRVDGILFMSGEAKFNEVNLRGANIGGQLNMDGSTFAGALTMDSLRVDSHLFMRKARIETKEPVILVMAKISGGLTLAGSKSLPSLDLTGAEIGGEFMLAQGSEHATWRKDAKLTLRNARVRAIQDCLNPETWPNHLEREGFTYDWLGGLGADGEDDMANREVKWYLDWLKDKQETFSPQPYKQLADVLENHGHKDWADDVRYASKERERKLAKNWREKGWRFSQKIFIGYGYRYRFTLGWVLGLISVGFIWLLVSQSGPAGIYEKLIFCLDKFLPLVKFREEFDPPIKLTFWIRVYFDFLQIMGYVLVSYLIAGFSGLTKK